MQGVNLFLVFFLSAIYVFSAKLKTHLINVKYLLLHGVSAGVTISRSQHLYHCTQEAVLE